MRLQQYINESINDKALLKAVFFVGYPGAGKTTISRLVADGSLPIMTISSDVWTEYYNNVKDLTAWDKIGGNVKRLTTTGIYHNINGLLPVFVDTTGAGMTNFKNRVQILEDMGYDISMVIVSVDKNTSIDRVTKRNQQIKRQVGMDFLSVAFDKISKAIPDFKKVIPDNFTVDNNNITEKDILKAYRKVTGFFNKPVKNDKGKKLIDYMKENGYKYYNEVPDAWKLENGFPLLDTSSIDWFKKN